MSAQLNCPDVKTGLLADLLGKEVVDLSTLQKNSVIVCRLTPSMTADIDKDHVAGIVTETGGRTTPPQSLLVLLNSLQFFLFPNITSEVATGNAIVVDEKKHQWQVVVNPSGGTLRAYWGTKDSG